ncbi:hypothetical protein ACWD5R_39620 [Streptomyces sp. NPDC002514]|uniref:hypothetical protein n=1 Tax=Streptomyces sp. NPDC001270 TaxID=3364554 RepID=UPI0036AE34B0
MTALAYLLCVAAGVVVLAVVLLRHHPPGRSGSRLAHRASTTPGRGIPMRFVYLLGMASPLIVIIAVLLAR